MKEYELPKRRKGNYLAATCLLAGSLLVPGTANATDTQYIPAGDVPTPSLTVTYTNEVKVSQPMDQDSGVGWGIGLALGSGFLATIGFIEWRRRNKNKKNVLFAASNSCLIPLSCQPDTTTEIDDVVAQLRQDSRTKKEEIAFVSKENNIGICPQNQFSTMDVTTFQNILATACVPAATYEPTIAAFESQRVPQWVYGASENVSIGPVNALIIYTRTKNDGTVAFKTKVAERVYMN